MSFKAPVWSAQAFDQARERKGMTLEDVAEAIKPLVGHIAGTRLASIRAFHAEGREPARYAITCAIAHVLEVTPDDLFKRY